MSYQGLCPVHRSIIIAMSGRAAEVLHLGTWAFDVGWTK